MPSDTISRAKEMRTLAIESIASIGVGHVGGSMSVIDILAVLYTNHLRFDPKNPKKNPRDRVIFSKAHAGPALYAALASFGFFDKALLKTLNKVGTKLPSHTNAKLTPGVDFTAGSLGQGISCAAGLALGAKLLGEDSRVYVVVGDGECQEGQVWEAAMFAAHQKLDNFTVLVDNNHLQIDGPTDSVNKVESLAAKFRAFGYEVIEANGHDHNQIDAALHMARAISGRPAAIVFDTVKGKGISFFEQMGATNHSTNVSAEQLAAAVKEING